MKSLKTGGIASFYFFVGGSVYMCLCRVATGTVVGNDLAQLMSLKSLYSCICICKFLQATDFDFKNFVEKDNAHDKV